MSSTQGINLFGSLTTQTGQRLSFEDFDKDGDGVISQEEYNAVLKEVQLDKVSLSKVDTNKDKQITRDEFDLWEQKTLIQELVNEKLAEAAKDNTLAKYSTQIQKELKQYMEDFISEYKGNVSDMASAFKSALVQKYSTLTTNLVNNDPSTVKNGVLESMYNTIVSKYQLRAKGSSSANVETSALVAKAMAYLEQEASVFIKAYKGDNLKADLAAHLNDWLNKTDADKMRSAAADFNSKVT